MRKALIRNQKQSRLAILEQSVNKKFIIFTGVKTIKASVYSKQSLKAKMHV